MPWPKETYSVTIDNSVIIVRTSNKKCVIVLVPVPYVTLFVHRRYFKRIDIPEMKTPLVAKDLSWDYKLNTLIIDVSGVVILA